MADRQKLIIVGSKGGTNIGHSFWRGAKTLGWDVDFFDVSRAYSDSTWLQRLSWHLCDRRPLRLGRFSKSVVVAAKDLGPATLISTGLAPLTAETLKTLKARSVRCLNYSTDDPWNPGQRARWFLRTLPVYDHVFSTRRANIHDLLSLGANVSYLPFGYDHELFYRDDSHVGERTDFDILFIGGAEDARARILSEIAASGLRMALYGDYWTRYEDLRQFARGRADPPLLRQITAEAAINLCLYRRANRDGHVMRSLEIAAIGGFILAEDSREHRELFGEEGECVLYFRQACEAIEKARWALHHPRERHRMAMAAHDRIVHGAHTYRDRLQQMLSYVN